MKTEELGEILGAVPSWMGGFGAPWCVAGGWAIDLFLWRKTRGHEDVELAVYRQDQGLLHRHFADWDFWKVVSGQKISWGPGELLALPTHEIHGQSRRDSVARLEFLLNERTDDNWVFRRQPTVRLPLGRAICASSSGLPILNPAIVLLYKAKAPSEEDDADFQNAFPALGKKDREWLCQSLKMCHPGHPWL